MYRPTIYKGRATKLQLLCNMLVAGMYFLWWFIPSHIGNSYLYGLLFFGEVYHVLTAYLFWFTLWPKKQKPMYVSTPSFQPSVDIFITVAGEPVSVVKKTIQAAKAITYSNKKIYVLNDGFVIGQKNWFQIDALSREESVVCLTRKVAGGAKAGNINHALQGTNGEIIALFDADMQPFPDFLSCVIPYFTEQDLAFVQTPQYYQNYFRNSITRGAWEQQEFFFGPIMRGKDTIHASFICGTNFAVRRTALEQVHGMCEENIAEDFLTSLAIHQKGWKSRYVSTILASGLAPEDLLSYYKQQLRWARGSLEVLFGNNPLLKGGLSFRQKMQYLFSALFYVNGIIVLIDMMMPLIFLWTGIMPVSASTTSFALFFIPFMAVNLYTLYSSSTGKLTFRAISFTQGSFFLHIQALLAVLLRVGMSFSITSKKKIHGNFISLIIPHMVYVGLMSSAIVTGFFRLGLSPALITNIAWGICNCVLLMPFISAAVPEVSVSYESNLAKDENEVVSPNVNTA